MMLTAASQSPLPLAGADADLVAAASARTITENTARAYKTQWTAWQEFADDRAYPAMPPTPAHIAAWMLNRANDGLSLSTVKLGLNAVKWASARAGFSLEADSPAIADALKALNNTIARPPAQAQPLDADALSAIRATAMLPRKSRGGSLETLEAARIRGQIDIALCFTMSDAGLRRSEAAALTWEQISPASGGAGVITIGRRKGDKEGGQTAAITAAAMRSLNAIKPEDASGDSRVFSLSASQISRRIAAAARAAGLGSGFSGHSGRVGMAVKMSRRGAPMQAVMRQGGWASAAMPARYIRKIEAETALQWL